MDLADFLLAFFARRAPLAAGDGVIAAFSGGPDSTALLWGLARAAERLPFRLWAAHLDHGSDPGSADRARQAARLAEAIGVPLIRERRTVGALRRRGESWEEAARRVRYGFLGEVRARLGARYVATAHHRDDQAETVALRLASGSGLAGLAGIAEVAEVAGPVVRPLLAKSRSELAAVVEAAGLAALDDPTNRDLARPRNRMRHASLPRLAAEAPDVAERLARLAARAAAARAVLTRRFCPPVEALPGGGLAVCRADLAALPRAVLPLVLAALHRRAGAVHPPPGAALSELASQLARRGAVGCDCGAGWRWESRDSRLVLRPPGAAGAAGAPGSQREPTPPFSYTLAVPGAVAIPELGLALTLARRPVEPWMLAGRPDCAGLALEIEEGQRVEVRNRRPGDRIRPLGAGGSRRLKEVLIDRRVPRERRDRLPLLVVGGAIAWVPGVTIDERFRLDGVRDGPDGREGRAGATAWSAEIEAL